MRKILLVCMLIVGFGCATCERADSALGSDYIWFARRRARHNVTREEPRWISARDVDVDAAAAARRRDKTRCENFDIVDFDCSGRKLRRKQSITFDGEGEVVDSLPRTANQPWVSVTSTAALGAVRGNGGTPTAGSASDFDEFTAFCRTEFAHR